MGYIKWFVFSFLYMTVINLISRDIGMVSSSYTINELSTSFDGNFFDAILYTFYVFLDNLGTMLQILTLQTELPFILNTLFISPVVVGTGIGIVVLIRGS